MKTFDVYRKEGRAPEAVKQGFCWPAFFFIWIWALVKGLPLYALAIFFAIAGSVVVGWLMQAGWITSMLNIIVWIWAGTSGNQWRADALQARGYKRFATLQASGPDDALAEAVRPTNPANRRVLEAVNAAAAARQAEAARVPCPFCAELILPGARVCRFCGRDLPAPAA